MRGAAALLLALACGCSCGRDPEGAPSHGDGAPDATDAPSDVPLDTPHDVVADVPRDVTPYDGGTYCDFPSSTWRRVPGVDFGSVCQLFEHVPGADLGREFTWQGTGKETVAIAPSTLGPASAACASIEHGVPTIIIGRGGQLAPELNRACARKRIVRLDTGEVIGAIGQESTLDAGTCFLSPPGESTTLQMISTPSGVPLRESDRLVGQLAITEAPPVWHWASPPVPYADQPVTATGVTLDGHVLFGGWGSVYRLSLPVGQWFPVEVPSAFRDGTADGDLAAWTEVGNTRIRGWSNDGLGVRTLLESAPVDTCFLAMSATQVVGITLNGACDGAEGVHFWAAARSGAAVTGVRVGPVVPGSVRPSHTVEQRTQGDYASIMLWNRDDYDYEHPYVIITQLSTWRTWRVRPSPGSGLFSSGTALDDRYLYLGENNGTGAEVRVVRQITRIPLAALDQYGEVVYP